MQMTWEAGSCRRNCAAAGDHAPLHASSEVEAGRGQAEPHDAWKLPEELKPLQAKARTSACGACRRRRNTAAPGSTCSASASSPRKPRSAAWALHPGLRRLRLRSADRRSSRGTQGADREVRACRRSRRARRRSSPSASRAAAPIPAARSSTRAEKKGDRYVLNGTKIWISGASEASWGIVFARTGGKGPRRHHRVHRREEQAGAQHVDDSGDPLVLSRTSCTSTTTRCRSRTAWARKARAFRSPRSGWCTRRVPYAAATIGIAQASLELADRMGQAARDLRRAPRRQAGDPVDDRRLRDRAARRALLVYEAAWKADRGEDIKIDASIAKVYGDRDRRPRGRSLHPDLRRHGRVQAKCRSSAGTASCASSASAKARRKCTRMVIARNMVGGRNVRG